VSAAAPQAAGPDDAARPARREAGARRRSLRRGAALTALALLLALGLAEAALRFLVLSPSDTARRWGASLRRQELFAIRQQDLYWGLQHHWGRMAADEASRYDAGTGWLNSWVTSGDYHNPASAELGARVPILLYGDSYAACTTPRVDCFEGLFPDTALAGEALLLNYGVGGYGLDQMYLLLQATLPQWDAHVAAGGARPIVVIGICYADDLDRANLRLRDHPRPHFRLGAQDQLQLEPVAGPSARAWLAEHPPWPRSWVWRALAYNLPGASGRDRAVAAARRETERRSRALLAALQAELLGRGYDHFVLLLPGSPELNPEFEDWRRDFLAATLTELGLPFIDVRRDFWVDIEAQGRRIVDYFGTAGVARGHYLRIGNEVALQGLLRGLYGGNDGGPPGETSLTARMRRLQRQAFEAELRAAAPDPESDSQSEQR
jgi:hypothetical protein